MAVQLQKRDKRALLLLGSAVALFAVLQLDTFQPRSSSGVGASAAPLQVLEQRLQLAQTKARQRPLTEAELNAAKASLARLEERLLDSENAALAQAEMRSLVGDLLAAEGIPMTASNFGSVALEGEDYAQVPLVVDFSCGIEQLVNLLAAIGNSPKLLTTRLVRIQPDKPEVKSVRVRLTVSGYLPSERTPDLRKSPGSVAGGLS
jgi:Tfp pilus assembly protein PilO